MKPLILCAVVVCLAGAVETPKFVSSSITPDRSDLMRLRCEVQYRPEPVRLTMNNVTLKFCLQQAYALTQHQVFGPGWIKSDRYDIAAQLPPDSPKEQVWLALQSLLDEHFKLSLRHETKVMRIYALTVAKGGHKLVPAKPARQKNSETASPEENGGTVNMDRVTMKQLCETLSRSMDRQVIDQTGITGEFEIHLKYPGSSRTGLGIFTAMQRQLGLKLEPRNESVEILIVTNAKR
jgi:uncharacterized protein (TIGR03435 family)